MTFIEALEHGRKDALGEFYVARREIGNTTPIFSVDDDGHVACDNPEGLYLSDLLEWEDWGMNEGTPPASRKRA